METLIEGFEPVSAQEWKARIIKDLKDLPFETLLKTDRNGITIKPFYNKEDTASLQPHALFDKCDWDICENIVVHNESDANQKALNALQNGASGLCFKIAGMVNMDLLLNEISIQHIYLQFDITSNKSSFIVALKNYVNSKGLELSDLNCCINYDFIAGLALSGKYTNGQKAEQLSYLLCNALNKELFGICIDGKIYQNAGANPTYELACILAQTNEYLHLLDEARQLKDLKKIHISLAVGTDYFEEIAKLRALQECLELLYSSYNIHPETHIHAETSNMYRSQFDSYTNLLRDSIAGMAAVLGGCNSLTIASFNGKEDAFAARMSRNQQLIFKEESYLNKVADVAAGSFYIETLTEQIAEKAWEDFKSIEKSGGLMASLANGSIQKKIKEQATQLANDYKNGKRVLIGVNKYPNPTDMPKKVEGSGDGNLKVEGLKELSLAEKILNE